MANLIQHLQDIDRRRARLVTYSRRIKMARPFAPETEQRMQANIDREFRNLTRERNQTLELIKADPVIRKQLHDLEEAARTRDAVNKAKAEAVKEQRRAAIRATAKALAAKLSRTGKAQDQDRER